MFLRELRVGASLRGIGRCVAGRARREPR